MSDYNKYSKEGFWKNKLGNYQKYYSDDKFWDKAKKIVSKSGQYLMTQALTIYYCMIDPSTPTPVKVLFASALGYLILPADLVPDLIPGVGLLDDAGALTAAVSMSATSIKEEHVNKAETKYNSLFS